MARTDFTAATNFYVNPGSAQSGWGTGNNANDGLSQANPKLTYQGMLQDLSDNYDFRGHNATINGAPNTVDTNGIHLASHAFTGAQGGAAIKIKGSTGSEIHPATTAIDVFNGAILYLEDIKVSSTNGAGINTAFKGQVYIGNGVEIGTCGAFQVGSNSYGIISTTGLIKISGGANSYLSSATGYYQGAGTTIRFMNNVAYAYAFVASDFNATTSFGGHTIDLNGFAVTGSRFKVNTNAMVISASGVPNTFFPGNSNGTTSNGGVCI